MWSLEKWKMILFAKQRDIDMENKRTTQGEKWRGDTLGDWDCHAYTVDTMYKIDT